MNFFDRNPLFLRSSPVGNWPVRLNARYQAIVEANREALEGANVLDIASHDGRWSYAVLDAGARHVTGVEVRPELVAAAEENFRTLNVDREKYDFETADLFESDALSRIYDVVLCLGFFYHTLRHLEAVERIVRCQPKLIILDTMITPASGVAISLVAENAGNPANGMDLWGVRNGKILVGHPSRSAVMMMFSHFGYEVTEFDWPRFMTERSIAYRQGEAHSGTNPMGDYGNAKRSTFVCRRVNGN